MRRASTVIFVGLLLAGCTVPDPVVSMPHRRHFRIVSNARIPDLPAGVHTVDLWMPIPSTDDRQTITNVTVETSLTHEIQTDADYSNQILHVHSENDSGRIRVSLLFDCTGELVWEPAEAHHDDRWKPPVPSNRLLQPDRLGVIDDGIRSLALQITAGQSDVRSQARAIYDYVIEHMVYDKTTPGWGNGDTLRACQVGKGNCTDFGALFISLARARGIPARFKIGCLIPREQKDGPISGYHCWAEFWEPKLGWIPVDLSEAWKHRSEADKYFGRLSFDRVQFSCGRDVRLPGSAGEPRNYFFAPYAEVDGKPVTVNESMVLLSSN